MRSWLVPCWSACDAGCHIGQCPPDARALMTIGTLRTSGKIKPLRGCEPPSALGPFLVEGLGPPTWDGAHRGCSKLVGPRQHAACGGASDSFAAARDGEMGQGFECGLPSTGDAKEGPLPSTPDPPESSAPDLNPGSQPSTASPHLHTRGIKTHTTNHQPKP